MRVGRAVWYVIWRFNDRFNSRPGPRDWRDTFHFTLAGFGRWVSDTTWRIGRWLGPRFHWL